MEGPDWLEKIMCDATEKVRQWPEGLRGDRLQAALDRLDEHDQGRCCDPLQNAETPRP